MIPISKIIVPARWADGSGKAIFQLGLGPCGKEVTRLEINFGSQFIELFQYCLDGEYKVFYYRISDLIGRVEIERYA